MTTPRRTSGKNLPANTAINLQDAVEKRNAGRLSIFTVETALALVEAIADGATILCACEKVGISRPTFYEWKRVVPGFQDLVTRAQELQAMSMVDDGMKALQEVELENCDPKIAQARVRKAEQVARFKFDLAKCFDFRTFGDKRQNLNVNINADCPVDLSAWLNK